MDSIRNHLTRNLVGAVLVILLGGLVALYFGAREAVTAQFDRTVQAKALAISTLTFQENEGYRFEFTDRFMRSFDDRNPKDFFQLWDDSGREIARSESLPTGSQLPRRSGRFDRPARWNIRLPTGRAGRATGFVFTPKAAASMARGNETRLSLVVASDRDELDETLWQLLALSGAWGILLIVATLWIVPRVLRTGLKPLDLLGEEAARIDAQSLSTRLTIAKLPAELRPIAQRLNDLFGRLQQSFDRERRFSADLAHELRTPLAELRSIAECALKWPESRDSTVDQDALAIAQQMERLVAHILALARGEQGSLAVKSEAISVAPLVTAVWEQFAARARSRELRVVLALEPVNAIGDAALLQSILTNLCENAVDYAASSGQVEIRLRRSASQVIVSVSNPCSDLQPGDVPKLFDRFWRKDAARSGGSHLGLGLSLSRSFAQAMEWNLNAALHPDGQIVFTLEGPLAEFLSSSEKNCPRNVAVIAHA